jgi:hypothetical protein
MERVTRASELSIQQTVDCRLGERNTACHHPQAFIAPTARKNSPLVSLKAQFTGPSPALRISLPFLPPRIPNHLPHMPIWILEVP